MSSCAVVVEECKLKGNVRFFNPFKVMYWLCTFKNNNACVYIVSTLLQYYDV